MPTDAGSAGRVAGLLVVGRRRDDAADMGTVAGVVSRRRIVGGVAFVDAAVQIVDVARQVLAQVAAIEERNAEILVEGPQIWVFDLGAGIDQTHVSMSRGPTPRLGEAELVYPPLRGLRRVARDPQETVVGYRRPSRGMKLHGQVPPDALDKGIVSESDQCSFPRRAGRIPEDDVPLKSRERGTRVVLDPAGRPAGGTAADGKARVRGVRGAKTARRPSPVDLRNDPRRCGCRGTNEENFHVCVEEDDQL